MSETKLFPSEVCEGYFGIKRFDRISDISGTKRVHMLTAAALLELDFEQPSLDYHSLMKLTKIITRDNKDDVENMFRRMCFNVLHITEMIILKISPICMMNLQIVGD